MVSRIQCLFLSLFLVTGCFAYADSSFDLSGPQMEVNVTRAGKTLPISEVPNLQSGDRLWIHPAFPDKESVHYLLVVAFLQGATNPPPDKWFTKAETWTPLVRAEGMVVTVPEHAQQALFFLAPQTSGDFNTLRSAVQGKPGAFVRAAQDLNLASQSRLRVDKYLSAIGDASAKDPKALHERSTLLARSLKIKVNEECFDKPSEQQAPCLMQSSDQMVMDDGHGQSMLAALSSGPEVDLLGAVSATTPGGGGSYSPYIGVIVDVAKEMENLRTAQYPIHSGTRVAAKRAVESEAQQSALVPQAAVRAGRRPASGKKGLRCPCLPRLSQSRCTACRIHRLPWQWMNAPLVFATELAHGVTLHVQNKAGKSMDLPVKPDPSRGGFVIEGSIPKLEELGPEASGTLHGSWGFESFEGPTFHLINAPAAAHWELSAKDENALVVGREDTFHLHSELAACAEEISVKNEDDKPAKTSWKMVAPNDIEVKVSLADAEPGTATLAVKQFGLTKPIEIPLHTYAEEWHLDQFVIHAGDHEGVLKGARLDLVASLEINGTHFLPASLTRVGKLDELKLLAENVPASGFQEEQKLTANVTLKDGRVLKLHDHR